jgi:hypothetical protein
MMSVRCANGTDFVSWRTRISYAAVAAETVQSQIAYTIKPQGTLLAEKVVGELWGKANIIQHGEMRRS